MLKVFRYALVPTGMGEQDDNDAFAEEADGDNVADPRALVREGFTAEIEMPRDASLINVAISSRGLTVYAIVDPEKETELRTFFVCSNGVELPLGKWSGSELEARISLYVGTFKVPGDLTAHVFETTQVLAAL